MLELVMATANAHKVAEVQALLPDFCRARSAAEAGVRGAIPEEQPTLEGNARQKAEYVYGLVGGNVFADDTGLEVDALGGAPGVLSARYAGPACRAEDNVRKLLAALRGVSRREARFRTVVGLFLDGEYYEFVGAVEGRILEAPDGREGFGYDPVFQPCGSARSFARMALSEKNSLSHRGRAIGAMVSFLRARMGVC